MTAQALTGITVLDLSLQLPGPYATMLLRALGARVIKVEPPGADLARVIDPNMFATLNVGKESLQLDLRTDGGRDVLHHLARRSDVVVEGFRPGVAGRLGASYEELSAQRPELVYCSISGYGQEGPYRSLPGHDLNYLGVAGGAGSRAERARSVPETIGVPLVDLASGTTAALAIVAALRERERTGRGLYLDVAMLDSAIVWSNLKWEPGGAAAEPTYGVFHAADGLPLTIAVIEDKFWRALCDALGWDDWRADDSLARHENRKQRAPEIVARLGTSLAQRPRSEWLEVLAAADVPAAPVHDGSEVVADPQVAERGIFVDGSARLRAPLPRTLAAPPNGTVPSAGEHAAAILAELDYDPSEVAALVASGAVPSGPSANGMRLAAAALVGRCAEDEA